ncbi:MAG: hypothetical protein FWD99_04290 [Oscillospiraceae bacterium]|nr:hypothetical protein [Oscillospiraceae bacterium]
MQSILKEFFSGKISPESQFFSHNSAYGRAMATVARTEVNLLAKLNDEEKILLEQYTDAQMTLNQITAVDSQVYGYKLGMLMTAEAFLTGGELTA